MTSLRCFSVGKENHPQMMVLFQVQYAKGSDIKIANLPRHLTTYSLFFGPYSKHVGLIGCSKAMSSCSFLKNHVFVIHCWFEIRYWRLNPQILLHMNPFAVVAQIQLLLAFYSLNLILCCFNIPKIRLNMLNRTKTHKNIIFVCVFVVF